MKITPPGSLGLGAAGLEYAREVLGAPATPVATFVLNHVKLSEGRVLAAGLTRAKAPDAEHLRHAAASSGIACDLDAGARNLLQIFDSLQDQISGRLLLMTESDVRRPGDPAARATVTGTSIVTTDGSVCYLKEASSIGNESELNDFLAMGSGYFLNCFVLSVPATEGIALELSSREYARLATRITAIINYIFDGECYSVWIPETLLADCV